MHARTAQMFMVIRIYLLLDHQQIVCVFGRTSFVLASNSVAYWNHSVHTVMQASPMPSVPYARCQSTAPSGAARRPYTHLHSSLRMTWKSKSRLWPTITWHVCGAGARAGQVSSAWRVSRYVAIPKGGSFHPLSCVCSGTTLACIWDTLVGCTVLRRRTPAEPPPEQPVGDLPARRPSAAT